MANRKRTRREEEELDRAYRSMTGRRTKKKKKAKKDDQAAAVVCCVLAGVLILGLAVCAYLYPSGENPGDVTVGGITAGNVPTAGQTPEDVPTAGQTPEDVPTAGQTPEDVPTAGQTPEDVPTAGQAAGDVTVGGNTAGDVPTSGISLQGMSLAQAREALQQAAEDYSRQSFTLQVQDRSLTISPQESGCSLDVDAAAEASLTAQGEMSLLPYLRLDTGKIRSLLEEFASQLGEGHSSTYQILGDAPSLLPGDEDQPVQTLELTIGQPRYSLDTEDAYNRILDAYGRGEWSLTLSCGVVEPAPVDLDKVYESTYIAPVDAKRDPDTYQYISEKYGYGFDLEGAKNLASVGEYGQVIRLPFDRIAPAVTVDSLRASQGSFADLLASYSTPHTDDEDRNTNLRLACQAINGMELAPGEEFSYNAALGKRTADKGYRPGDGYMNGLTVKMIGGGICQVSSTLYYCTLTADLEILERYAHSYVPEYMPKGTDAAVSWGTKDFRFRNSGRFPIRIEAWVADGSVNVRLWGTEEKDYFVKLDYEQLSSTASSTEYRDFPPDNPEGYTDGQEIVTPYDGCSVKTYQYIYDQATGELRYTVYVDSSRYRVRNRIICRIVQPEPVG